MAAQTPQWKVAIGERAIKRGRAAQNSADCEKKKTSRVLSPSPFVCRGFRPPSTGGSWWLVFNALATSRGRRPPTLPSTPLYFPFETIQPTQHFLEWSSASQVEPLLLTVGNQAQRRVRVRAWTHYITASSADASSSAWALIFKKHFLLLLLHHRLVLQIRLKRREISASGSQLLFCSGPAGKKRAEAAITQS